MFKGLILVIAILAMALTGSLFLPGDSLGMVAVMEESTIGASLVAAVPKGGGYLAPSVVLGIGLALGVFGILLSTKQQPERLLAGDWKGPTDIKFNHSFFRNGAAAHRPGGDAPIPVPI